MERTCFALLELDAITTLGNLFLSTSRVALWAKIMPLWPYHQATGDSKKPLPDPSKISRCLVPFQSRQERRICRKAERGRQVNVVRTCYSDNLQDAWEQLRSYCISQTYELFPKGELLDDAQLYDVGERWLEVLIRMPSLVDTIQGMVEEDYEDALPWSDEDYETYEEGSVDRASLECVNMLYVVDEEALREQLVKMKWLDWRGESVWECKIEPKSMASMAGALANGLLLYDFVDSDNARWGDVISL